jgi:hypothetical protein
MILKGHTLLGVASTENVAVLTRNGKVLTFHIPDVPFRARSEEGWPLHGLPSDDAPLALNGY